MLPFILASLCKGTTGHRACSLLMLCLQQCYQDCSSQDCCSHNAVPLLLLGTAGDAPVDPVAMTSQELAKRCGLVFQFPERYFLGGTLQDVSTWSGSCCQLACCVESLLPHLDAMKMLMQLN